MTDYVEYFFPSGSKIRVQTSLAPAVHDEVQIGDRRFRVVARSFKPQEAQGDDTHTARIELDTLD